MATIQRSLSTKVNDNGKSEIMLRLSLSKNDKIRIKSGIFVLASRFKDGAFFTKRFKALFHWCHAQGITMNNPFAKYVSSVYEKYGTPIYIKDEEVLQLADFDFSYNKHLDTQRDIFIFQCCIGCRVGDMMKMTPANVINGGVEYIASKTAEERPETIRVPLSERAQFIIDKHREEVKDGRLLPFISQQKYNEAIKEIFEAAGITRLVTRLNPTTGVEEQVPINTIATSHMARRTFVGNLYKKVKDQNLVGALSGHSVGSKAFARYREIDEDMKRELVNVMGY